MLVVGAVALATLGPKEILKTVRLVGGAARKMRMTAWEFREQIESAVRDLDDEPSIRKPSAPNDAERETTHERDAIR